MLQEGAGTVTLTGSNTYAGGTTIFRGTVLQIGSSSASGLLGTTGPVVNNGNLVFGSASSNPQSPAAIGGSGTLLLQSSATLVLTGNNAEDSGTISIGRERRCRSVTAHRPAR